MKERYDNLDGLRAISCLCIIAMHIKANANYSLGKIGDKIVDSWTQFVPLFLMISGFGMFCGYYERFKNGNIDLNTFFAKRYKKILPFFITLILIDIVVDRTLSHIIEGIMESTLVFGLLPNNQLDVIGVSWTLGVIFLFYMLFPFIVYLCWTKRRTWITFCMSIILSFLCSIYFFTDKFVIGSFTPRHNFLYCAPWVLSGGIVFLNRDKISKYVRRNRWAWLICCIAITILCFVTPGHINSTDLWMLKNIVLFMPWLMYAISVNSAVLNNGIAKYISSISLELYLAQMIMFRVLEKINCLYLFGNGWFSFIFIWVVVVLGLIAFIEVWKKIHGFTVQRYETLTIKNSEWENNETR